MLFLSTSFQLMRTSLHGSRFFPTHATTGELLFIPSVSSFASFLPFLTPKIASQRRREAGGCSEDPQGGQGAQCGPVPSKQGKGYLGHGTPVCRPTCPTRYHGVWLLAVLWVSFFGIFFVFSLSSSVGQIPSADERRDNQLPQPEPAKPRGSSCALRQGKRPPGTPNLPPGLRPFQVMLPSPRPLG